jgi:hypothetical protein
MNLSNTRFHRLSLCFHINPPHPQRFPTPMLSSLGKTVNTGRVILLNSSILKHPAFFRESVLPRRVCASQKSLIRKIIMSTPAYGLTRFSNFWRGHLSVLLFFSLVPAYRKGPPSPHPTLNILSGGQ